MSGVQYFRTIKLSQLCLCLSNVHIKRKGKYQDQNKDCMRTCQHYQKTVVVNIVYNGPNPTGKKKRRENTKRLQKTVVIS